MAVYLNYPSPKSVKHDHRIYQILKNKSDQITGQALTWLIWFKQTANLILYKNHFYHL